MSTRFPGRRLSPFRLVFLLIIIAALGYVGTNGFRSWQDSQAASGSTQWFASYVDVTASPTYSFEQPLADHEETVVLSFIVAADDGCDASWGGYHSLEDANSSLDLDRRIARLQQGGGNVVISFGGEANSELALGCDSVDDLVDQYRAVIDRYNPAAVDFDIEGGALSDTESRQRRARAIAIVQDELPDKESLPVWLTLPVGPDGLTTDGVTVIQELLAAGVDLAGVNAMTMNYSSEESATEMSAVIIGSLEAVHRQVVAIYADAGVPLGSHTAWRRIGATPMIGQNNVVDEVFTLDDARDLSRFADDVGLGRMSMWSANRDRACADAYIEANVVSDSCSGIGQGEETFADILSDGFPGNPSSTSPTETETLRPEDIVDNPETSPYPIWNETASYPAETRVVWRKNVYVAEWWNSAIQPDDPAIGATDNPWQLIGPVLPGESPIPVLTLPDDYYPSWDPDKQYTKGDRIIVDSVAYEAQWWTTGETPASGEADPGSSPWRALSQDEIARLLDEE